MPSLRAYPRSPATEPVPASIGPTKGAGVLEAAFWGFVGGAALLLGAVVGIAFPTSQRTIGIVMAFGSGVLISALAFELTEESYEIAGADAVTLGLADTMMPEAFEHGGNVAGLITVLGFTLAFFLSQL